MGSGETLSLDDFTLYSPGLKLVGRPDRIVKIGKMMIPEEWKSAKRINHGHKLQMTVYLMLLEAVYGVRPTHGFVVLGDGTRVRIDYEPRLVAEVERNANLIRSLRRDIPRPVQIGQPQPAWKCRACGQRSDCRRKSA